MLFVGSDHPISSLVNSTTWIIWLPWFLSNSNCMCSLGMTPKTTKTWDTRRICMRYTTHSSHFDIHSHGIQSPHIRGKEQRFHQTDGQKDRGRERSCLCVGSSLSPSNDLCMYNSVFSPWSHLQRLALACLATPDPHMESRSRSALLSVDRPFDKHRF